MTSNSNHFVQFYEKAEHLVDVLYNFVSAPNVGRDAVIIVAIPDHLDALTRVLEVHHVDVTTCLSSGQLLLLDANEFVDNIVVSGIVDHKKFNALVEEPVGKLLNSFEKVYFYGELVNVLCTRKDYQNAMELEMLCHSALSRYNSLVILCGYNMNNFGDEILWFERVCNAHDKVSPTEEYTGLPNTDMKDLMITKLQKKAKALEISRRIFTEKALQQSIKLQSIRAGDALVHERQIFYALLQVLPVGVYGTQEKDGTDLFVNSAFLKLSGLREEDVLGCAWFSAVHPEDRDNVARNFQSWKEQPIGTEGKIQYRFVHPGTGSVHWVAGETVSNMEGFIHTIVDLTDLKAEEQRRIREKKIAEEIQRFHVEERKKEHQDQYVDTLCHELRNPLSGIGGNIELVSEAFVVRQEILSKKNVDEKDIETLRNQLEEDSESIQSVDKCVNHLTAITDDVLNLSKLELGKLALQQIPYRPNETLVGVMKMFYNQSKKKGIGLKLVLPPEDLRIIGDPHRLAQILVNLVSNSVKFTDNGNITVYLEITETIGEEVRFRVTVEDTGIGLADDEQATLFNCYCQMASPYSRQQQGLGLGLWISKRLVELMGGVIYIEGKKNLGSKFTFTFLGTKECSPSVHSISGPCQSSNTNNVPNTSTKRCLIVEDNDINQRVMCRLLSLRGFNCAVAGNGQEALKILDCQDMDLVIMDVEMPVMDGMTATAEIRKRERALGVSKHVPIIGVSGNARENRVKEALNKGMDHYLTKPVRKDQLYKVIDMITSQF